MKVKHKLKKHLNTRKSPLTRKESAPATVKHRVPDTLGKYALCLMKRMAGHFLFFLFFFKVISIDFGSAINALTTLIYRLIPKQQ